MFVRPGSVRTTLAAPLATSVALLTAMPTSAWRSAGASLTPSPVMPVTCPAACRCCTTMYLSSGYTSAKPSAPASRSTASLPGCAAAAFRSATRRMWGRPTPVAISRATGSASPVSLFTSTPSLHRGAMSCAASGRAALLHEPQHGVDDQQRAHHDQIRGFTEEGRQQHDDFEH